MAISSVPAVTAVQSSPGTSASTPATPPPQSAPATAPAPGGGAHHHKKHNIQPGQPGFVVNKKA